MKHNSTTKPEINYEKEFNRCKNALENIYAGCTSPLLDRNILETKDDYQRMLQACIKDCRRISRQTLKQINS